MKILYAVTAPQTATNFLKGQLAYMNSQGHEVHLATSPGDSQIEAFAKQENASFHSIQMAREICLLKDFIALLSCVTLLKRLSPDVVNYGTPKASVLFAIAAFCMRVKVRNYTVHGLRHETCFGLKRYVLVFFEKVKCRLSTGVLCVSNSVLSELANLYPSRRHIMKVIHNGSCNGVDVERLRTLGNKNDCDQIRKELKIQDHALVFGYVGRVTRDKGINELVDAFKKMNSSGSNCHLLIVGPIEFADPISVEALKEIDENPSIHWVGPKENPVPYYLLMDVLVLPTYREGLGYSALEAAALARPVITTHATGAKDSIEEGRTGILVPPGDANALQNSMEWCLGHRGELISMGQQGYARILSKFCQEDVWVFLEKAMTAC